VGITYFVYTAYDKEVIRDGKVTVQCLHSTRCVLRVWNMVGFPDECMKEMSVERYFDIYSLIAYGN
jgi:hypothetical protein